MKKSKQIRLPVILLTMLMTSCFSTDSLLTMGYLKVGQKYSKYGSSIEVVEWDAGSTVEYKSHDYLVKELEKEAELKMWSQDQLDSKMSLEPKGGYIIVHIKGLTIEGANTRNWEYHVRTLDDKPIKRIQGTDRIPDPVVTQYASSWRNIDLIYLETEPGAAFKVYVISDIWNARSCFIVRPNQ